MPFLLLNFHLYLAGVNNFSKKVLNAGYKKEDYSKDLLVKLKCKEMHRQWNQGHGSWEIHRDAAQICTNGIKKARAQSELSLGRNAKNNWSFCRYVRKGRLKKCKHTHGHMQINKRRTNNNKHGEDRGTQ